MTTGHNGGNSARAQQRIRANFVARWQIWARCPVRSRYNRRHCELRRRHLGRHAWADGFDVHYSDGPGETP
jgi:hypothetical protein